MPGETKQPLLLEAKKNTEENLLGTYNFNNNSQGAVTMFSICNKCKHLDSSDEPNFFCNKHYKNDNAVGMVDCDYCMPECPLGKWKLVDPEEQKPTQTEEVKSECNKKLVIPQI